MKTVKMLKTACGPNFSYTAKRTYNLSDEMAQALNDSNACVIVGVEPEVEPEVEVVVEPEVEVVVEPEVVKAKPRGRRYHPAKAKK